MRRSMASLMIACLVTLLLGWTQGAEALEVIGKPKPIVPTGPTPITNTSPTLNIPKDVRPVAIAVELDTLSAPTYLNSWQTAAATVALTKAAPSGGATIALSCNDPSMLALPPTVTVPAGSLTQAFTVSAKSFGASGPAILIASYQGIVKTCSIQIHPGNKVSSITGLPNYIKTASQANGTVRIAGIAPTGGWYVPLYIHRPADTVVPASVFIPAGQSTGTFTIASGQQKGMILIYSDQSAYQNTSSTGFTSVQVVLPPKLSDPAFQICTQNSSACSSATAQVESWQSINLKIGITTPYPEPTVMTLTSSNPQVATVPPSVTFNNTYWYGMVPVSTRAVTSSTPVIITVKLGAETKTAQLQVNPGFMVSSLSISPSSVKGGTYVKGTVTLNKAATAGGVQASLTSSNPNIAIMPSGVTVPQGQTSATFSFATITVTAPTSTVIKASFAGMEKAANLNVTP
jgi:hypothetical protein